MMRNMPCALEHVAMIRVRQMRRAQPQCGCKRRARTNAAPACSSLDATPVFLGCSDVDAHIPLGRVRESADVFRALHANVDERIYEGMGHTVNKDEIDAINAILSHD